MLLRALTGAWIGQSAVNVMSSYHCESPPFCLPAHIHNDPVSRQAIFPLPAHLHCAALCSWLVRAVVPTTMICQRMSNYNKPNRNKGFQSRRKKQLGPHGITGKSERQNAPCSSSVATQSSAQQPRLLITHRGRTSLQVPLVHAVWEQAAHLW